MPYYNTCSWCGSNLDPGERCNCQKERHIRQMQLEQLFSIEDSGQMYIRSMEHEKIRAGI